MNLRVVQEILTAFGHRAVMAASANPAWREWGAAPIRTSGDLSARSRGDAKPLLRLRYLIETGKDVQAGAPKQILFMKQAEWEERHGADFKKWLQHYEKRTSGSVGRRGKRR